MFGFLKEEAEELGSVGRFYKRIEKFKTRNEIEKIAWKNYKERVKDYPNTIKIWEGRKVNSPSLPKPLPPVAPKAPVFRIIPPIVEHHFWWLLHNCVAHMLIGIIPITPLFKFHDWTSRKLNADMP